MARVGEKIESSRVMHRDMMMARGPAAAMSMGWHHHRQPLLLLATAAAVGTAAATAAATPPHLLLVVIDDLGIDDVSVRVNGSTDASPNGVVSPHLQALASDGVVLTDYHVFKFCSPSRTQMLTGRYAYHVGQQSYMNLNPDGARCGINTSYAMLPALLAAEARGYRTYMLGKWCDCPSCSRCCKI